jgi:hypothetical protein
MWCRHERPLPSFRPVQLNTVPSLRADVVSTRKAPPLLSPRATKHGPVAAVSESLYHTSPLELGKSHRCLLLVNLDIDVTSDGVVSATVFTVSYRTHDRPEKTYR